MNTCCTNNGNYYQNEHFYWHISRVVMYANVVLVLVLINVYDNILPNDYKTEKWKNPVYIDYNCCYE